MGISLLRRLKHRSSRFSVVLACVILTSCAILVWGAVIGTAAYRSWAGVGDSVARAEEMIKSGRIYTMSKAEVDSSFGPAARSEDPRWDVGYRLGPSRSIMPIADVWLLVKFDDNATVRDVRILRD